MKLVSFRIKNFRSIRDTDWCDLSPDNITGLIGQNESGKTAIVEALYSFDSEVISEDDLRADDSMPEVSCSFQLTVEEFDDLLKDIGLPRGLKVKIKENTYKINLTRIWSDRENSRLELENTALRECFEQGPQGVTSEGGEQQAETQGAAAQPIGVNEFIEKVYENTPPFELFKDLSSLLPNTIDLADLQNKNESAEGYKGATNFLKIANLDISKVQSGTERIIKTQIEKTSKDITKGFQNFWRQQIGKAQKVKIEVSLDRHSQSVEGKAGQPYLSFWLIDDGEKLYPKQRSRGLRWFLSFYIELRASAQEEGGSGVIYLIDEPGGSLHARAQEDVLKVFDSLGDKLQVIYTTHSPFLIQPEKIYRLLAVQREDVEEENSETKVLGSHQLGAASSDTLSPLYVAMGVDFSSQQVIKKTNNVLLEEPSAFYYLKSFWKLVNATKEVHFLPATGTSKVPQLAYLLQGWGLDFLVAVDDDSSGRGVYNELKKNLFADDEQKARSKLIKIKDCKGIEDVLSKTDFKKYALKNEHISYPSSNSEYMKSSNRSKPVIALDFMLRVEKGEIKLDDFKKETQRVIKGLVNTISSKLS